MFFILTEQHIKTGKRGSPTSCPLAIMFRQRLGKKVNVGLTKFTVIEEDGKRADYTLPNKAAAFRAGFDMNVKDLIHSITFTVEGL